MKKVEIKSIKWNEEKNKILQQTRNICFEDILLAIQEKRIINIEIHPKKDLYPHQKIIILEHNKYIYIIPFIENETEIFLKTIYPDRIYYQKYKHLIS